MRQGAKCNRCQGPIVWARWESKKKWVAVNPKSRRANDRMVTNDFGQPAPVFETWHTFHKCADKPTKLTHEQQVSAAFATLYLTETAPPEVVKAAYRALAAIHHPDRGGDTVKMQNINLAFELAQAVRS